MDCNPVQLYHEFLNQMEDTLYHHDIVDLSLSEEYAGDSPKSCGVKLNLDLDINRFYGPPHKYVKPLHRLNHQLDQDLLDHYRLDLLESLDKNLLNQNLDQNPLEDSLKDSLKNPLDLSLDQNIPLGIHPHLQSDLESTRLTNSPKPASFVSLDEDDDVLDEDNLVCPGLFPSMKVNDPRQFIPFDVLPLNPAFVGNAPTK